MKKYTLISLVFLLVFCIAVSTCMAEGKLTVVSKNAIIYYGKDSGVLVGKVENTGDEPIYYDNGKLVIFSEDDDILATENYVYSCPSDILLQPGESAYFYEFLWSSPLKNATIGDVKFSVTSDTRGYTYDQLPASAEIEMPGSDSYNYVNVTFTNTTEEVLYGVYVVCAMTDADDNVIFVNRDSYSHLGVHPGSTVTLKMYIDSDLINYYEANNIRPAGVDARIYYNGRR